MVYELDNSVILLMYFLARLNSHWQIDGVLYPSKKECKVF